MSSFEEVEGHEDGEEVHVGRVELEVDAGGAEVVAGGHHPDHEQGHAHRVEQAVIQSHSFVSNSLCPPLFPFNYFLHPNHFDEE